MPPVTENRLRAGIQRGRPASRYRPGVRITGRTFGGRRYTYTLMKPAGKEFDREFKPHYSPAQMLRMGVFSGRYLNDATAEFPKEWFADALEAGKLCPEEADPSINLFKIKSRKSSHYWIEKGWIPLKKATERGIRDPDHKGWFQWYCRYWIGRRVPGLDELQIARWKSFKRHSAQVENNSPRQRDRNTLRNHRPRQRQALLQWAYNPWV